ncbi:MAG: acylphosphatase [Hydrogenobacter thermophilus]|jgi:acylphosphatase|uniref:Acylphosphatase n=1 Tax=Hydrogenobacter thermophilus (strain DSM 6534 / IAM 12695 / TK-6) TaxID=608538 RepID=D3DIN7_HYDTT|nr:acylphosphatase [Hydrogenobacter thermophilus]ADO45615.1 acylphosphatase [Hydrogenobacter thermophilus TK-6]MCS7285002.1 acylphosphatase [Hydrogenobacter thermophilus]BAI69689.1 acylphosphatase [Hydrogenobacter thermophilus TK-6]
MVAYRVFLSGIVQGVGFRAYTKTLAESYGLDGWVRNMPDGRVEVFVQGDKDTVWDFFKKLSEGPPLSKVELMEIRKEVIRDEERGFSVRY